ncbi:MAG: right-handed parallel beta-helix repeat-containing protein [Rhizobium sp.]|nr:right-handed parallel beta-helix repeat-containing protein [Rhizobium sp.]
MRRFFHGMAIAIGVFLAVGGTRDDVAEAATGPIRNATTGAAFEKLKDALSAAGDGDTIEISGGPYFGNFVIDRRITLRGMPSGEDRPVLDGESRGSVLTVNAPGVVVENLALRNSGREDDPFLLWGYAGVRISADGARLSNLHLSGNDWGIVMLGAKGSTVETSLIEDNAREGIAIFGGREHQIQGNTILRNATGIAIDALHTKRRSPLAALGDPETVLRLAQDSALANRSEDILVSRNEVRGNGSFGITATWHSHRLTIEDNVVHATGIERKNDAAQMELMEKTVATSLGLTGVGIIEPEALGSGIYILCDVEDSLVVRNRSFDNLGTGIFVSQSDRNELRANVVTNNESGIFMISSTDNLVVRNAVAANRAFGIRIGGRNLMAQPSADNLLTLNDMAKNGVNAFDSSGRVLTTDDLVGIIDTMPYPEMVKQQLRSNRSAREALLQGVLANLKPGTNRWDDGSHGNRYDDFDEKTEGFVDRNGDGMSEAGHAIAGGTAVDHHPLDAVTVARLSAAP